MPIRVESQAEPIPGYKLIERLGGGGFGEVWKAEAPGGLLKAIKFVHGDLQTTGDEFQRAEQELKALSRVKSVRHPYILSLERFDIIEGRLMIVMELADRNLWDRFKECRSQGLPGIPRNELLGYMEETAEALDLMNIEHQLQHLDIKPQNLFLVHNHVKVADFGLVKDLAGRNQATMTGGVTPVYAAPETFDGILSRYCDQYSLAIVYQELLSGLRPFVGATVHQLVMQHVQGKPNLASLSESDRLAVARALAKRPEQRHPTCMDFVRALRAGDARPVIVGPATAPAPPSTPTNQVEVRTPLQQPITVTPEGHAVALARPQKISSPISETPVSTPIGDIRTPQTAVDGDLMPALVIGLGSLGGAVLRRLRQRLCEFYGEIGGKPDALPHLRLLHMDTDAQTLQSSRALRDGAETLLVRLNRASHYIRPRDGRPPLDSWLDKQMLYRIQRNQGTDGLRVLGRLAFLDNFRALSGHLRNELELCAEPRALAAASANTNQQFRTLSPRVYIVTSLAGGCGSGMFLDLAYVVRRLLRDLGHTTPDVVGLLLLPSLEIRGKKKAQHTMALGNTFAALTELKYYSLLKTVFDARFDTREPPLTDPEPPFGRCVLLAPAKGQPPTAPVGVAGGLLFRDLTTPLGRIADICRDSTPTASHPGPSQPLVQTAGLYRLAFPKRALLKQTAVRLCHQLVQRWVSKDAKPVQEQIRQEIQDQWLQRELGPEFPIARFQEAATKMLGRAPEAHFAALIDPLIPTDLGGKGTADFELVPLTATLSEIQELLGKPAESVLMYQPGRLEEVLADQAKALGLAWQELLAEMVLPLIDRPGFRLPAAEEAARQLNVQIEKVLHLHEALSREMVDKSAKGKDRLLALIKMIPEMGKAGRRSPQAAELVQILRAYPKWRYQAVVLKQLNALYTSLRGFLSDRLLEINYCRARLLELVKAFTADDQQDTPEPSLAGPGHDLFPDGCQTLDQAVEKRLAALIPQRLDDLDRGMQDLVQREFQSLFHVCSVASPAFLHTLGYSMEEEAIAFADTSIGVADVVAMFQASHADEHVAMNALEQAFDEAAPVLGGKAYAGPTEICVLAIPPGQNASTFREWARKAVPEAELFAADSPDDIVFYRERTQVRLADLEYMGDPAREAYRHMTAVEHFTPHSRLDIVDWSAAGGA